MQAMTELENRVLVLSPVGRDAALISQALTRVGITTEICQTIKELGAEINEGAGAALISEDVLTEDAQQFLVEVLSKQPSWSDLPLIIFTNSERIMQLLLANLTTAANITLLERPLRVATLVSAVRAALRARGRQYQTQKLLDELQQVNKIKDEFLATISHELRTPLTAILGWARLLQNGKLDETTQKRAIETIERNAKAQAQLIEDLLDISRIITGKLRLEIGPVSLPAVIEAAIDSIRLASEAKEIKIISRVDLNTGKVLGDPGRLQQVIWNLLSNAIKYTPRGGQVEIKLEKVASHIEIRVCDNGKGISQEFLPYIFDKFRQADNSIARSQGGLGLGLSIVSHIVELHGGIITAASDGEGKGTTITVHLPVIATLRAPTHEETYHPQKEFRLACPADLIGVRVLVVEDEADTREIIAALLATCQMDVKTAASTAEALEILDIWPADLLISDIGMPGEDGYQLIGKIRAMNNKNSLLPAIALTAYARVEDKLKSLNAGFQIHITKPVEPVDLIDAISELTQQLKSK